MVLIAKFMREIHPEGLDGRLIERVIFIWTRESPREETTETQRADYMLEFFFVSNSYSWLFCLFAKCWLCLRGSELAKHFTWENQKSQCHR